MITERTGDIFSSQAQYITIPVNTAGIAGAGLAKQFALKFPVYLEQYHDLCFAGMTIGKVYILEQYYPKSVILFPTKRHWRNSSYIYDILRGLVDLDDKIKRGEIHGSVAIPRLGCGLGGLDWEGKIYPLVQEVFSQEKYTIEVYIR